jgi:hypothetical protein
MEEVRNTNRLGSGEPDLARILCFVICVLWLPAFAIAQASDSRPAQSRKAHYDGAEWHLKGEGVVCCPCSVPCPCRTNGGATYGHCEATLYLHIREGHYGHVGLNGLSVVDTSGACGMSYEKLAALYFDRSTGPAVQEAFLKLLASFPATENAEFPYVRTVPINAQVTEGHFFHISIPGILEMIVDRNWGETSPPLQEIAAQDRFSNVLQYIQNIRYRMHDEGAKLNFDYSRRQANYRAVDLDVEDYRSRKMLIQFMDGTGWFTAKQLRLIQDQNLPLPDLKAISQQVARVRQAQVGKP